MSRRTFLENMRQEVRKRDASDPDSPHNTHSGNSSTPQLSLEAPVSPTQIPTTATAPAAVTPQIAVVAANTAVTADTPLQENALLGTHMTEFTTVSATTIVSPRTLTPPPPDSVGRPQDDSEAADVAVEEGAGRVSGRPTLSPDVLHVDDAIAVQEQPFGADTPPSWQGQQATRRSSSHTQHGRSSSHATVPDVLVTPRRSSLRRSSMPRGSISQSRRSGSVSSSSAAALKKRQSSGPATAAAAASAAAAARRQSRERASSVGRMEASLIALQVELATEKRNNIEAEHHIMTLNAEVEMLRRENGRLSREVAEAATQAAAHHASHKAGAAAAAEAAVAVGGPAAAAAALVGDAAVAATRIEALEARLQELSRNLETKQRELDTKDERVRLLEHKLADTLLLQSGVHYMAVPGGPAGAPGQPGQTAYYYPAGMPPSMGHPAGQQGSNNASQSGSRSPLSSGSPASPVNGRAAPRRLWQGDAPNTATAGPRVGAIRSIASLGAGQHPGEAPAHPRAGSAVRKRSPVGHSEGPTDSLQQLTALPARETANAARTPTPPPSSAADAAGGGRAEGRAGSAQRRDGARPPSVRRSSARRKTSAASRTSSVDHTASGASPAAARDAASAKRSGSTVEDGREAVTRQSTTTSVHRGSTSSALRARASTAQRSPSTGLSARRSSALRRTSTAATDTTDNFRHSNSGHGTTVTGGGVARTNSLVGRLGGPGAASPTRAGYPGHVGVSSSMYNHNSHSNGTTSSGNGGGLGSAHSVYAKNQRALSTYRNARAPSATRSIAQRSSTSLRSRPQIAFSADGDTSTMRGTTTTVTFRTRESRAGNLSVNSNNNSAVDSAAPPPPPVAMTSGGRFAAESSALI